MAEFDRSSLCCVIMTREKTMKENKSTDLSLLMSVCLATAEEDTSLVDVSKLSSILDTSVTSTIDAASIFSGGFQRSNSLDDNYSIIGSIPEEEEEEDNEAQHQEGWVYMTEFCRIRTLKFIKLFLSETILKKNNWNETQRHLWLS